MKKRIILISIFCLILVIQTLMVNASGLTGESSAGITFTDENDPEDPKPEDPKEEEKESPSTPEDPKEIRQSGSADSGTAASTADSGVLPQTGEMDPMILSYLGGSLLLIFMLGMGRKRIIGYVTYLHK